MPKTVTSLPVLPPYARQLVEQPEILLRVLNYVVSALSGQTITDIDIAGSLALQENPTPYTIAAGVITISEGTGQNTASRSAIAVETEAAAATDDLDTINGGRDGMLLLLRAYTDYRTVVIKNGTGNIIITPAGDITLDTYSQFAMLVYNATLGKWIGSATSDTSAAALAHDAVTIGDGSDEALSLSGQKLTLANVLTPTEHTAIGNTAPHHAAVTLGAGSDAALALAGQELTLANVLTPAEHTAIGDTAPHHAAVTLGADAGAMLGLSGQQIDLDVQDENKVFAGPAAAPAADPTFRALVDADIPSTIMRDAEHTAIGDAAPHHAAVTIGADAEHSLAAQVLSGVDAAAAQKGHLQLAGELGGTAAAPTITATHSGSAHHAAVTLAADADTILGLNGQELILDIQVANRVLAGPVSGADADPTFRALVEADIANESITSKKLAPSVFLETCTADVTLNSANETDITGCSIAVTPAIASTAMVWATVDMNGDTVGDIFVIYLDVDGTNQSGQIIYETAAADNDRKTVSQLWVFNLTAAAHTIKLQGVRVAGTGTCSVAVTHTKLALLLIGDANASLS